MRSIFILFCIFFFSSSLIAQSKDEQEIRAVLAHQQNEWNNGNLEAFMHGYWESDSLLFVGKSGVKYGYNTTLQNYKKGYPDRTAMGKLAFTILEVKKISADACFVVGKWALTRTIGDVGGHFTLLFRKINTQWLIVADHSS